MYKENNKNHLKKKESKITKILNSEENSIGKSVIKWQNSNDKTHQTNEQQLWLSYRVYLMNQKRDFLL